MSSIGTLLTFIVISSAMAADVLPQRPMEQMHGDCSTFGWNMEREFKLWESEALAVKASATSDSTPIIPVSRKVDLALLPHSDVRFSVPPETDRGGPGKFSGLATFTVDKAGVYRISASSGLWIDVVANGKHISSRAFEMQTGCKSLFKSVAYELPAHTPLIVQLNGSTVQAATITITSWEN
ncbi:MAG: hypothetical protein IT566_14530 [Rhodospirillaceae bacterium]|nr:hypothetical protein [Rhodospirillaceae bacterium]